MKGANALSNASNAFLVYPGDLTVGLNCLPVTWEGHTHTTGEVNQPQPVQNPRRPARVKKYHLQRPEVPTTVIGTYGKKV